MTPLPPPTMHPRYPISRGIHLALCITALAWAAAADAVAQRGASGFAVRLNLPLAEPLLHGAFLLFLLVAGLRMLDLIATRGEHDGEALRLPRRSGWPQEWGTGAALGWALCLADALPVLLSGHMHAELRLRAPEVVLNLAAAGMALAALLLGTLAEEVIFRGYAFQRLIAAAGEGWAATLMSLGFAMYLVGTAPPANLTTVMVNGALLGGLLAMAWLRTRALWLGWGLNFAYRAVAGVILGLPIAGRDVSGFFAETFTSGPRWLTGGPFGLDAAVLTAAVLLVGMGVLYRVTRDYAWHYAFTPIVAKGYEVTIPPPAAHAALERAAAPPPLVQILAPPPPPPVPLRAEPERDSLIG